MPSLKKLKQTSANIPTLALKHCIGKTKDGVPGMTTIEHSIIVATVSTLFIRKFPIAIRRRIKRIIKILCILHDIGKISPGFIIKIYGNNLKKVSPELYKLRNGGFETMHAAISESFFRAYFKDKEYSEYWAVVVGVHHGKRGVALLDHEDAKYGGKAWADLRIKAAEKLLKGIKIPVFTKPTQIEREIYAAVLSLSDWIASDERMFDPAGKIRDIIKSAYEAIEKLGWKKTEIRPGLSFKDLFGFDPRPAQQALIDNIKEPGVYILEDSTGAGKTEAALIAAYNLMVAKHSYGIYFALPTRVTSQRIFERTDKFLIKAFKKGMAPHLIHGQSLIADPNIGGEELALGGAWFTSNRRALLLPFGIGTLDQILMCVLNSKYNFIRTLGLANKVIIVDELHSYDVYTGKLTDLLIDKLRELNCTVIVLSATLTYDRKKQLLGKYSNTNVNYPLITYKRDRRPYTLKVEDTRSRQVKVRKIRENFPKIFREIEKRVLAGQQVLYILNTVDRATAVYDYMKNLPTLKEHEIGLIHSRFPGVYRNKIEEYWIRKLGKKGDRSKGSLLISTQVFEQSVDVDADFMVTDIAPSDFIVQRIGRVFRHERNDRKCTKPEIWISCPDIAGAGSRETLRLILGVHSLIYSDYVLWRTYRTWKRISTVLLPDDSRKILEVTYRDPVPQDPAWVKEAWQDLNEKNVYKSAFAEMCTGNQILVDDEDDISKTDSVDDDEPKQTRLLSVPTRQILLVEKIKETSRSVYITFVDGKKLTLKKGKRPISAIKTITERMIKVPATKALKDIQTPDWLSAVVFGKSAITTVNSNDEVCLYDLGSKTWVPTRYYYRPDYGVYKNVTL